MVIKNFIFPSFEKWSETYDYTQEVGMYTCRVARSAWNTEEHAWFEIAISTSDNPLNWYVRKIFHKNMDCSDSEKDTIKKWYEEATKEANVSFEKHIIGSYFENTEE